MRSKTVLVRERDTRPLCLGAVTHAQEVASTLAVMLKAYLKDGEEMPDIRLLVELLGRSVDGTMRALAKADDAHEAELTDDADPRRRRDEKAAKMYAILTKLRSAAEVVYGSDAVALLGFSGPTPHDPTLLRALGHAVLENLPKLNKLEPKDDSLTFDPAKSKRELTKTLPLLEEALNDVAREAREAEATLASKQRALAAHDERYPLVAMALSSLFALGGNWELANKVRPPSPAKSSSEEEPSEEERAEDK